MKTKEKGLSGDLFTADEIVNEAERIRRIEAAAPEYHAFIQSLNQQAKADCINVAWVEQETAKLLALAEGRAQ